MNYVEFGWRVLPDLLIGFPARRPGGLLLSLMLGATAAPAGFLLALPLGVARRSPRRWVQLCARAVVETIRGVPLVFLMIVIHSVGTRELIGVDLDPLSSAWIALALYATAYQTEIVRAGLGSVPQAQRDAAAASGLRRIDVFRWVELPQAVRAMAPALAGHTISLFKDTSVVLVLGVADLMTVTKAIASAGNEPYFLVLYSIAGILYFVVAFAVSRLAARIEASRTTSRLQWLALEV